MVANQENEINRDRGLLSPSDRKFLLSNDQERKENYSQPAQHKRHQALSSRLANGLQDLSLLADRLETEDRDRVLEDFSRPSLRRGAVGAIALVYELSYIDDWDFGDVFFEGIDRAYRTHREGLPIEKVQRAEPIIDTDRYQFNRDTVETAKERYFGGENLTDHEIAILVRYTDVEIKQILESIRENERNRRKDESSQEMANRLRQDLYLAMQDADEEYDNSVSDRANKTSDSKLCEHSSGHNPDSDP